MSTTVLNDTPTDPIPGITRSLRVSIPARVGNDLTALKENLRIIAASGGHRLCASGCDTLHFDAEREFSSKKGEQKRRVIVGISSQVNNDIELLSLAVENVMGRLGCLACCSGFDIEFQNQVQLLSVGNDSNVTSVGA